MSDSLDFNFDTLTDSINANPFVNNENKKSWKEDERFYVLPKDADGNGQALVVFLPDPEKKLVLEVVKYNLSHMVHGKRRFVNFVSPQTCGLPDPFQEEWAVRWNSGDQTGAREFIRSLRYFVNIKVIKDPKEPSNEGKIFLYDMSKRLYEKVKQAMCPSKEELELGGVRKEVFNPFKGYVFKLSCRAGQANGFATYDASEFIYKPELEIYKNTAEAVTDIKEHGYKLSWFLDPANYPSYDELCDKKNWYLGNDIVQKDTGMKADVKEITTETPEVKDATPAPATKKDKNADDFDALINDVLKDSSEDIPF